MGSYVESSTVLFDSISFHVILKTSANSNIITLLQTQTTAMSFELMEYFALKFL